jgi:hypothetical protein
VGSIFISPKKPKQTPAPAVRPKTKAKAKRVKKGRAKKGY